MRSIFLWRLILLITITVLLASLLTTGGYMYLSLDAYTAIKLEELQPEAEAIGQLYLGVKEDVLDMQTLRHITDTLLQPEKDTRCLITDETGRSIYESHRMADYPQEYLDTVYAQVQRALAGETVTLERFRLADGSPSLAACVPILDQQGVLHGTVFLLKPFSHVKKGTSTLNNSLFRVMLIVLPIMMLFASVMSRKMTEPLRRMGEVAIRMRNGDFDVRADENQDGEAGLLARALNDLCDTLSQTIHQLQTEKGQLKQILASFSEGVAAVDSVGCLTHYNEALKQMFGTVRIETRMDLIPDPAIWEKFDEVDRTGEAESMRYPLQGGRMLWITISPVITEDGGHTGVVGLFKDMTEMENLERTRREYIANISHELRTPLTAVRGLLEPLADGMVSSEEDRQRYYKIMLREVLRLSRLITDMLQLSRLQSGTEYMEIAEVDIQEILEDVLKNYEKEAGERGIALELEMEPLPPVLTDPDRVEQVLIILLDNALKHTPEGGKVMVRAQVFERVNISVIDTGSGIPEEDQQHIFERFYTVDKSRKAGGTGLGLSIAQHIITKLGEKIMVESTVGEGSCFTFTLKRFVVNAIALGPAREEWETSAEEDMLPPLLIPQMPTPEKEDTIDAEYEVLPEQKQDRKRGKPS